MQVVNKPSKKKAGYFWREKRVYVDSGGGPGWPGRLLEIR